MIGYGKSTRSWLTPIMSVLFSLIIVSCQDQPTEIDIDFKPSGKLKVGFTDTITVNAYTNSLDSVRSDEPDLMLLGMLQDPVVGTSRASFLTQLRLPDKFQPGEEPQADSVILFLEKVFSYGDSNTVMNVEVRESFKRIYYDSAYYSNLNVSDSLGSTLLGSKQVGITDTIIKIHLDPALGTKLLADSLAQVDQAYFLNYFKGLHVTVSSYTGNGMHLTINLISVQSKLELYYHNTTDTLDFNYIINTATARVGLYEHDYATADPALMINHLDDNIQDTVSYVQGMAGVYTKIEFPFLDAWIDSMPMAMNHFEMVFPLSEDDPTVETYPYASRYGLYTRNEFGDFQRIFDSFYGEGYFGGFVENDSIVTFSITTHIQNYLEREIENADLYLFVADQNRTPNRSIFTTRMHQTNPMRVRFTFTSIRE